MVLPLLLSFVVHSSSDKRTFWHFTDFHVDTDYEITDSSGPWGTYERDTSTIVAFTGIEWGNDHGYAENEPDFVIWGGDSAPHSDYTEEKLISSLQFLSHHFKLAFDPKRVGMIPIIGNHDVYPPNEQSPNLNDPDRERWCSMLARNDTLWRPWVNEDDEELIPYPLQANFSKNCFHAGVVSMDPFIVVFGLNSLVWYTHNPKVDQKIADPLKQFQWLTAGLDWLRRLKAKAIIATHVPPGAMDFYQAKSRHLKPTYNEQFMKILREYSDVIITTLASHEHVDTFRVVLNETYHPVGTILLAPSVDPFRLEGVGSTNPRIRQYVYDRLNGVILDYFQYYLDLSQPGPSWKLEYQFSKEYSLKSLSAQKLGQLLDEFTVNDDRDKRWSKFWYHQLGGRPHELGNDQDCSKARSVCRCQQICTVRHLDEKTLDKCLHICAASNQPQLKTIEELQKPEVEVPNDVGKTVGIVIGVILALGLVGAIIYVVYRKRRGILLGS